MLSSDKGAHRDIAITIGINNRITLSDVQSVGVIYEVLVARAPCSRGPHN